MSKIEHHFIVKYSKEGGWEWDIESEEVRFVDGTVWDTERDSWSVGYLGWNGQKGEAEYLDDDDLVGEQLGAMLDIANGAKAII